MSDLVRSIRERWIAACVSPREGASVDDLSHFEARYAVQLPPDFAAFYRAIDGMPPNEMDDEMIRWWPLAEVTPADDCGHDPMRYRGYFIFADWSLDAHLYAINLSSGDSSGEIVISSAAVPISVAASFGEFLDLYVRKSRALYGPEQAIPRSDAIAPPPSLIDGARVLRWSVIDERHQPTGGCRQVVAGRLQGPAAGLAICQHDGQDAFYLFGCDGDWNTVTDTWHETLESAMEQAEFEYSGVCETWIVVA